MTTTRLPRLFALVVTLALSSCALRLCGGYACRDDDNCPAGEECYVDTCYAPSQLDDCVTAETCDDGYACVREKCVFAYYPDGGTAY